MTLIPDSLLEDIGRRPDRPKDDPAILHDPITGKPWKVRGDPDKDRDTSATNHIETRKDGTK